MVSDGNSGDPDEGIRRYARFLVPGNLPVKITGEDGREQDAAVTDISAGGAGLIVDGLFGNNDFVEIHMDGFGGLPGRVARKFAQGIGVEFDISENQREAIEEDLRAFRKTVSGETY